MFNPSINTNLSCGSHMIYFWSATPFLSIHVHVKWVNNKNLNTWYCSFLKNTFPISACHVHVLYMYMKCTCIVHVLYMYMTCTSTVHVTVSTY